MTYGLISRASCQQVLIKRREVQVGHQVWDRKIGERIRTKSYRFIFSKPRHCISHSAFINSRHPHRHPFLLQMKLNEPSMSMLVEPMVLRLTSVAWNLGHSPLPVRSGIHRRQADHSSSSRDRKHKITFKNTVYQTQDGLVLLLFNLICRQLVHLFSVQTLSEVQTGSDRQNQGFVPAWSVLKATRLQLDLMWLPWEEKEPPRTFAIQPWTERQGCC